VGKFSSGFIALAQKTNALILPIGIKGANLALPKHAFLPRPEKVSIHLGNLIDLALYKEKDQEILAEMIRNIVIRLSEKHPCGAEIAP
jgi:1-acyl-sn-glycerol-3-phosphate acyltransferase